MAETAAEVCGDSVVDVCGALVLHQLVSLFRFNTKFYYSTVQLKYASFSRSQLSVLSSHLNI